MNRVLPEVVPIHAAEYLEGWVGDALFPKRWGMIEHDTEKGIVLRNWRDLAPGDAAVNNLQAAAMTIVEMCEHYQVTSKDTDARMALHEDLKGEIYEMRNFLANFAKVV